MDSDPLLAQQTWQRLGEIVDLEDVAQVLEAQGVEAFEKSFLDLLEVLARRCESLGNS